jgi:hypothetical protein
MIPYEDRTPNPVTLPPRTAPDHHDRLPFAAQRLVENKFAHLAESTT